MEISLKLRGIQQNGELESEYILVHKPDLKATMQYRELKNKIQLELGPSVDKQKLIVHCKNWMFEPDDGQMIGEHLLDGDHVDVYYHKGDGGQEAVGIKSNVERKLKLIVGEEKDDDRRLVILQPVTRTELDERSWLRKKLDWKKDEKFGLISHRKAREDGKEGNVYVVNMYKNLPDGTEITIVTADDGRLDVFNGDILLDCKTIEIKEKVVNGIGLKAGQTDEVYQAIYEMMKGSEDLAVAGKDVELVAEAEQGKDRCEDAH